MELVVERTGMKATRQLSALCSSEDGCYSRSTGYKNILERSASCKYDVLRLRGPTCNFWDALIATSCVCEEGGCQIR